MELRYPVVLASGSPRRLELLRGIVAEFEVLVSEVDESLVAGESPVAATIRLAIAKARAVHALRPQALVIGGDTLVALSDGAGWTILGKPDGHAGARAMLRRLSGREHVVTTGICILGPEGETAFADSTRVTFRELTDEEIGAYVATGECLDKAGSYAIQGLAASFVAAIDGSVTNVVGLPTERLEQMLRPFAREN